MKLSIGSKKNERGNSMVEFAIVMPFWIAVLFGMIAMGTNLTRSIQVVQTSRDLGNMYAQGTDFSALGFQNLITGGGSPPSASLVQGMNLDSASGNAVIIFSKVRHINAADTEWYADDVRMVAAAAGATAMLPKDDAGHGFDNVTVGALSPTLLNRYITAAEKISRLAIGSPQRAPGGDTFRASRTGGRRKTAAGYPPKRQKYHEYHAGEAGDRFFSSRQRVPADQRCPKLLYQRFPC